MQLPIVTDSTRAEAERIRSGAELGYATWRSRPELNPDAIRAGIARAYLAAVQAMDALKAQTTGNVQARTAQLTAQVFGVADLAGSDPATRAQLSVSLRDAQDRAESIDPGNVQEAMALFTRAAGTGDELLCRALAQRAWNLGALGGWDQVLDAFTATRPAAAQALSELGSITTARPQTADLFAFALPTPPELQNVGNYAIEALAADAVTG